MVQPTGSEQPLPFGILDGNGSKVPFEIPGLIRDDRIEVTAEALGQLIGSLPEGSTFSFPNPNRPPTPPSELASLETPEEPISLFDGRLTLDKNSRIAAVDEKRLTLPRMEFGLLLYFMEHPDILLERSRICTDVWREGHKEPKTDLTKTFSEHLSRVRKALDGAGLKTHEPDPKGSRIAARSVIKTVRQMGYVLDTGQRLEDIGEIL